MICLMITLLLAFDDRYRAIKGEGIKILALENATKSTNSTWASKAT